jgi:hypothetical protein
MKTTGIYTGRFFYQFFFKNFTLTRKIDSH